MGRKGWGAIFGAVALLVLTAGTYVVETGPGRMKYYEAAADSIVTSAKLAATGNGNSWTGITSVVITATEASTGMIHLAGGRTAFSLASGEVLNAPVRFKKVGVIAADGDTIAACTTGNLKFFFFGE